MKGKTILLLLAAAGTLSLAGCQKTGLSGNDVKGDGTIRFSASAKSAGTKTEYGAFDKEENPTWQSIDWTENDQIRIYSNAAVRRADESYYWADYGVTGITAGSASSQQSTATLTNLTPGYGSGNNGLYWGSATSANFYAIYPKPAAEESSGNDLDGTKGILAGNIPASQSLTSDGKVDMSLAYMVAAGSGDRPDKDDVTNVPLYFYPAFTAFDIQLAAKPDAGEITVMGFELISDAVALSGPFTMTFSGFDAQGKSTWGVVCPNPSAEGAEVDNKVISYSFGTDGVTIDEDKALEFTVFALPQDLTNMKLRFSLADETTPTGTSFRTLQLKTAKAVTIGGKAYNAGDFIEFAACKKHRLVGVAIDPYKWVFSAVELGLEWDVDEESLDYADDPIINAGALYHISGATDAWKRTEATFAGNAPIIEYFTVFAPTNGNWVVTNSNPDVVTISAADATLSEDGKTLSGPINGRVDLTITKGSGSGTTAELNFYVEVDGHRYSINSEVTRGGAQVITK